MIGTDGCMALCDLLSGGCGTGMAGGAEMPIEPDTPSGELEPGIMAEPSDPGACDIPGVIGGEPGIIAAIPGLKREVPAEDAVGAAAGYVASVGFDDAYPPPALRGSGARAEAWAFGF
ncbi:MAG TPA: hypothetical protein VME45_02040 [Stellaceae bacterium]|nr:hypothetical protein [Stellaceae bacterium]